MATEREAVICLRCGATMNYHAQKCDVSGATADLAETAEADDSAGSSAEQIALLDIYGCPRCGASLAKRVVKGNDDDAG